MLQLVVFYSFRYKIFAKHHVRYASHESYFNRQKSIQSHHLGAWEDKKEC